MSAEAIPYYQPEDDHPRPELKLVESPSNPSFLMMHVLLEDAAGHVLSYRDEDRRDDGRPHFYSARAWAAKTIRAV